MAVTLVLLLSSASAAPGDLDPSFGSNGYVTTSIGEYGGSPAAVVLQPDGKIVVGGSDWNVFALVRYLPDGSLDPGFGSAGIVTGPPGYGNALALQPDGKLLLAGSRSSGSFAVVRYLPDGSIDRGFGTNGAATGRGGASGIALQPDGRIVVVGGVRDPGMPGTLAVARFNADGSRDLSFGTDGVVTTHIGPSSAASAVSIQEDGKILVAGTSASIYSDYDASVVLARYSADGTLDPGFGTAGILTTTLETSLYAGARLALQPDGRILAVGSLASLGMSRYLPDGSADISFGTQGIVSVLGAGASGIVVQPDGRIVVGGTAGSGLAVLRFEPDGALDTGFGDAGIASTTLGWEGFGQGVAVQPDGRIVVGGIVYAPGGGFAVARFLVATPSSIAARPLEVDYGRAIQLTGTLTTRQSGPLTLLRRACYDFSRSVEAQLSAAGDGEWAAQVLPGSRTTYWAAVGVDTSSPLVVSVRPLLKIERLTQRLVRARVLFGHSLDGETVVLQKRSGLGWFDFGRGVLKRIKRTRLGVVSGVTFRVSPRVHQPIRLWLPQNNPYDCFAEARSAPIR